MGGETMGFKASGSICNDLRERCAGSRAPLLTRLRVTLFSHHAIVHAVFVLACITGVALNLARTFSSTKIPNLWDTAVLANTHDRLVFFVTRLGWPPLFWMQFIASALTPIIYIIWPPTQPDREELLDRDEKTGVTILAPNHKPVEGVQTDIEQGVIRRDGTSYATPIAAGTAAMVLDLVRQELKDSAEVERRLKNVEGMSEVFLAMSGSPRDGGYYHVRPWTLLGEHKPIPSPHNANETPKWHALMAVLSHLHRFGPYEKPLS